MKRAIFIFLVIVQILIIVLLVYFQVSRSSSSSSLSVLSADNFSYSDSKLQYFFEPNPGVVIKELPWSGEKVQNTINVDKLHSLRNYEVEKGENVFRILTLGDSFTFGEFVASEKNWVYRLENLLDNCSEREVFEVVNLGVPGYDIQYAVERFETRGKKYQPDLVIWYLKDDDFLEIREVTSPLIEEYITKHSEISQIDDSQRVKLYAQSWRSVVDQINKDLGSEYIFQNQKSFLSEFKDLYDGNLLVISTDISDINLGMLENIFLSQLHFHFLSNYNYRQHSFYPNDLHPNERGHEIISNDIYAYLVDSKIVPCD